MKTEVEFALFVLLRFAMGETFKFMFLPVLSWLVGRNQADHRNARPGPDSPIRPNKRLAPPVFAPQARDFNLLSLTGYACPQMPANPRSWRISASYNTPWCAAMSAFPRRRRVAPRFSAIALRRVARPRHRTAAGRDRSPGFRCLRVASNPLSLRLAPAALRSGDNMLDRRPREPEFPRDRRRPEPGLPGGQDQPLLPLRHAAGPVRRPRRLRSAFPGSGPAPPADSRPANLAALRARADGLPRLPLPTAGPRRRRRAGGATGRGRPAGRGPVSLTGGRSPGAAPAVGSCGFPAFPSSPVSVPRGPGRPSPFPGRAIEGGIDKRFRHSKEAIRNERQDFRAPQVRSIFVGARKLNRV